MAQLVVCCAPSLPPAASGLASASEPPADDEPPASSRLLAARALLATSALPAARALPAVSELPGHGHAAYSLKCIADNHLFIARASLWAVVPKVGRAGI